MLVPNGRASRATGRTRCHSPQSASATSSPAWASWSARQHASTVGSASTGPGRRTISRTITAHACGYQSGVFAQLTASMRLKSREAKILAPCRGRTRGGLERRGQSSNGRTRPARQPRNHTGWAIYESSSGPPCDSSKQVAPAGRSPDLRAPFRRRRTSSDR